MEIGTVNDPDTDPDPDPEWKSDVIQNFSKPSCFSGGLWLALLKKRAI